MEILGLDRRFHRYGFFVAFCRRALSTGGNPMPISDHELHQLRTDRAKRISNQVTEHRNGYYVRSQTGGAKQYSVRVEGGQWKCSCDDFKYRADSLRRRFDFQCKHILAVEMALKYGTLHGTKSIKKSRGDANRKQSGAPRRRSFVPH